MASYTLAQLQTQVGNLTGYEEPFVTAAETVMLINSAISRLRIRLAKASRALFLDTGTVSVVSGTASYDLPAGCYKAIAVYVLVGSEPVLLDEINWLDRYRLDHATGSAKESTVYAIRGGDIWLTPKPTWTDSLYIDFLPTHTPLVDAGDAFTCNGLDGWDQWVIGDVCEVLATKAKDPSDGWRIMKAHAQEILSFAAKPSGARPRRRVDTHSASRSRRT